ncbi:unnamed protein product [Urochloa humidicola]
MPQRPTPCSTPLPALQQVRRVRQELAAVGGSRMPPPASRREVPDDDAPSRGREAERHAAIRSGRWRGLCPEPEVEEK